MPNTRFSAMPKLLFHSLAANPKRLGFPKRSGSGLPFRQYSHAFLPLRAGHAGEIYRH
jgi:hypothetical protein